MSQFPIYTCPSINREHWHRTPCLVLGLSPSTTSAPHRSPPAPAPHDRYRRKLQRVLSHQQGELNSLHGAALSLVFLFPLGLAHPAASPSCSLCQSLSWSQVTTAKWLQSEFPLRYQKERRSFRFCDALDRSIRSLLRSLRERLSRATFAKNTTERKYRRCWGTCHLYRVT